MKSRQLITQLHEIGAIRFGTFKLKSGIESPFYVDLRLLVSHPQMLQLAADLLWEKAKELDFDLLCGVPYTALPIATALTLQHNLPMVVRRKEIKSYGTGKAIEGSFEPGQRCLIVEDLITSGTSILETTEVLEKGGLKVKDAILLLDRQQGGVENLQQRGYAAHALFTIDDMLAVLREEGRLDATTITRVQTFLEQNRQIAVPQRHLRYDERVAHCTNRVGCRLLELMERKRTNLSFNPDVRSKRELLQLADAVGPEICLLKTHIDIVEDFDADLTQQLQQLAHKHQFLIFEDRKFADIGSVVQAQYAHGIYHIADWADITNAHVLPGPGIIEGLQREGLPKQRGLLLLAQMSSKGNLLDANYAKQTVQMAQQYRNFVIGFVGQERLVDDPGFIVLTPGVQLESGYDDLGQQFRTPEIVIGQAGCDIIQVGRGIYQADNPRQMAELYRQAGWAAYEARC